MKREIYITLLLFAFMLFALISTMVRGEKLGSEQCSVSSAARSIDININANGVDNNKFQLRFNEVLNKQLIKSSVSLTTLNRGLQVVNWSSRSLFALLHSRGFG